MQAIILLYPRCVNDVTLYANCITVADEKRRNFTVHFKTIYMPILTIIVVLVVTGLLLWIINEYTPIDKRIKGILSAVAVVAVLIWLLKVLGIVDLLK